LIEDQCGSIQILVIAQRFCVDDERLEETKWLRDGCYSALRYKYIACRNLEIMIASFPSHLLSIFVKGIVLEDPFLELSFFFLSHRFNSAKKKKPFGCFVSERKVLHQLA
jgi:hypothetical protein